MNPAGIFKDGVRQREWSVKDLLPTSAKLIPEFDRRQSIRDMFSKKAAPSKTIPKPAPTDRQVNQSIVVATAGKADNDKAQSNSNISASQSSSQTTASTAVSKTTSGNNTSAFLQKPPPTKRQAESSTPSRPQKKGKVALNRENSTNSGFAQSSLKGFFKPKTPTPTANPPDANGTAGTPTTPTKLSATPTLRHSPRSGQPASGLVTANVTQSATGESPKPESSSTEKVFDPIVSKESWSKLLGKRVVPKCEHGDDCQTLVTKKAGVNCGMHFSVLQLHHPHVQNSTPLWPPPQKNKMAWSARG
jgi:AP endonuclease-2